MGQGSNGKEESRMSKRKAAIAAEHSAQLAETAMASG
jgi:hypothetical protein